MKTVLWCLGLLLVTCAAGADETLFRVHTLKAGHSVRALHALPFFTANTMTLVARGDTADGARLFSFYPVQADGSMAPDPVRRITLPEHSLFFDFGRLRPDGTESLLVFDAEGVQAYHPGTDVFSPLVSVSSIYRHNGTPLFETVDFAADLSGDGLADILVPDFEGYHLFVNDGTGRFPVGIRLDMPTEMRMPRTEERYVDFPAYTATPRYTQFPHFSADANFDGLADILFLKDRAFMVFHQKPAGGFETDATVYPLDIDVIGNSFAEQIRSADRYADQRNLAETIITRVMDINTDSIPDIVTETDRAEGLFNRTTQFAFHYGRKTKGRLSYAHTPDSTIELEGFAAGTRYVDFTGDGRPDFATGAVDIGLGKIISILLSGSAGVHVHFFEQHTDGTFAEKADYRKKISVAVDLSSGQSTIPVVELADMNGDGLKDLILSRKQEELRVYPANPADGTLFEKHERKLDILLPKNNRHVTTADVNGDGRADILIHYDRLGADGANMADTIRIVLAR